MRKLYIVKNADDEHEFLCSACVGDDDTILEETVDNVCEDCGYEDLEG